VKLLRLNITCTFISLLQCYLPPDTRERAPDRPVLDLPTQEGWKVELGPNMNYIPRWLQWYKCAHIGLCSRYSTHICLLFKVLGHCSAYYFKIHVCSHLRLWRSSTVRCCFSTYDAESRTSAPTRKTAVFIYNLKLDLFILITLVYSAELLTYVRY